VVSGEEAGQGANSRQRRRVTWGEHGPRRGGGELGESGVLGASSGEAVEGVTLTPAGMPWKGGHGMSKES
jgi:hypothetical protein